MFMEEKRFKEQYSRANLDVWIRDLDTSYLRRANGVTRLENERCGVGTHGNGVKFGVVEWVKRNTLLWLGHMERKSL